MAAIVTDSTIPVSFKECVGSGQNRYPYRTIPSCGAQKDDGSTDSHPDSDSDALQIIAAMKLKDSRICRHHKIIDQVVQVLIVPDGLICFGFDFTDAFFNILNDRCNLF